MELFQSLFGIKKDSVRKNCLLLPFLSPGTLDVFGVKQLARGEVFSSANSDDVTLIKTGISAGLVGDAVLYLQDAPCENIFFLGSCGLLNQETGLDIGSLILPQTAYAFESFSDILNNRLQDTAPAAPDASLLARFLETTKIKPHICNCVSFASLHEEGKFLPLFQKLNADVLEMECAALFLAARKTGKKTLALLYISDIISGRFGEDTRRDKKSLAAGACQAAMAIKKFTTHQSNQDASIRTG